MLLSTDSNLNYTYIQSELSTVVRRVARVLYFFFFLLIDKRLC